jgi:hypothetical protein
MKSWGPIGVKVTIQLLLIQFFIVLQFLNTCAFVKARKKGFFNIDGKNSCY